MLGWALTFLVIALIAGLLGFTTVAGAAILWDTAWGGPGMSAVSGDYDGDGVWDLAAYQEAGGPWYIRTVAGDSILWDAAWGGPGMRPVGE